MKLQIQQTQPTFVQTFNIFQNLFDTSKFISQKEVRSEFTQEILPNSYFSSDKYIQQTAAQKLDDIWSQVIRDKTTSNFPSAIEFAQIFTEDMNLSFDQVGDAMPSGKLWGSRRKLIHSVGVVGKAKFVSNGEHSYSGLFKGSDYGLVRLSSAAAPSQSNPLIPGMAVKFLRDGIDSANFVSMNSTGGQPNDWDFFSKDFYNHIAAPEGIVQETGAWKFSTATKYIQQVGLSDFADQQNSSIEVPFRLRFEPHSDVKNLFPVQLPGTDYMAYISQLESIPQNSTLYNVYALSAPSEIGGTESLIGYLQLQGAFTRSKWGDENLFFRHQRMNDDAIIHPEWIPYLPTWPKSKSSCPFAFLS